MITFCDKPLFKLPSQRDLYPEVLWLIFESDSFHTKIYDIHNELSHDQII